MDKPFNAIQAQNYATLGIYNQGSQIRVPTPASSGLYIVPVFGTYGYSALTGERVGAPPSASGYFSFENAYGSCSDISPDDIRGGGTPYVRSSCM
jgi:hypothetical protein